MLRTSSENVAHYLEDMKFDFSFFLMYTFISSLQTNPQKYNNKKPILF